jgi:hypothetical protein
LSAAEGRNMRPTFVHVLTGVLLGTALTGLLSVPGQIVAHQESIPPVRSQHPAKPKRELVVRVSPEAERPVVRKTATPPTPRVVVRRVLVPTFLPAPQAPAAQPSPPKPAAKPKPRPKPAAPPPPKTVLSNPQPPPPPPPPSGDDEDDDDDDDDGSDDDDGGGGGGGGGDDDDDDGDGDD